jgi:tetratricopeptide (TPR) repeat protein
MLQHVHPDATIIQTLSVGEAPFLAPGGEIPDDAQLQLLVRRNTPFPLGATCRYRGGVFEILIDPTDVERTINALGFHANAAEQIAKHDYAGAIASLQSLLELNPYCSSARIDLSQQHARCDRSDEALDELVEGLRIDPQNPDYYSAASFLLADTEAMLPVAERYAVKAIELDTRVSLADYVLGNIAGQRQDYATAIRHFDRVLELHPGASIAHHGKGLSLLHMGRFKSAATEFEKFFTASRGTVHDSEFMEDTQGMYLACCVHLEKRTRPARSKAAKREMARVEAELGWCVELREDPEVGPKDFAPTIIWRNGIPPGTVIIRGQRLELDDPDFLLHSLMEIRIETRARQRQKQKHGLLPTLREQAEHIAANCREPQNSVADELGPEERDMLSVSRRGLCASAISEPHDWLIAARMLREFPVCKWGLLFLVHKAVKSLIQGCADEMFEELFAPDIRAAYTAMVGASALMLADFSNGALDLTAACRKFPVWSRSVHIADHWKNRVEGKFKPGDEAGLIDEIAAIAGFIADRQVVTQGRLI